MKKKELFRKKQLLGTAMNKLGLGPIFNSWFTSPLMRQDEVITLRELIRRNSEAVTRRIQLVTWRNEKTKNFLEGKSLTLRSKSWENLYNFLIAEGFTPRDWVLLFPETSVDFDFFQIQHEDLPLLPLFQFAGMRPNQKVHLFIQREITKNPKKNVLVGDVLKFTEKEVACLVNTQRHYKTWLIKLQIKLIFYKLTGPFTELQIEKRLYKREAA